MPRSGSRVRIPFPAPAFFVLGDTDDIATFQITESASRVLARYLGAIEGTRSIAALHLPGRRPGRAAGGSLLTKARGDVGRSKKWVLTKLVLAGVLLVAGCGRNPRLTWHNESRYDGIVVERALYVDKYCVDFEELATLPGDAVQYVDENPVDTGACYRIRGYVDTPAGRQYSGYSETKTRR